MKELKLRLAVIAITAFAPFAHASNPILDSLRQQGVTAPALSNETLSEIKGAALISGQPAPSVTAGLKSHHVSYKGWGAYTDYGSYNYMGNSYDPSNNYTFQYQGGTYRVAGDEWLADLTSGPNTWSAANAQLIEYHYQILDPITAAPTTYGFRETAWNRPISTFSW